MITICQISKENSGDIRLVNEPFRMFGRLIPTYDGKTWGHGVDLWEKDETMCFPDENYDFAAMEKDHVFLGAYEGKKCVGLAVLRQDFFKYMYIYDLKVNGRFRGQGIGKMLLEKAMETALSGGYNGLYVHAQDNNLGACLFYLGAGFSIGGFDNRVYTGTSQEGKADITFYKEAKR